MARFHIILLLHVVYSVLSEDGETKMKATNILGTVMKPTVIIQVEHKGSYWKKSALETIQRKIEEKMNFNKAKNGIMFIGDGMSLATIMAARNLAGQKEGKLGEGNTLQFERFPVCGLARTYCLDAQVPDSACTATSYLGGVKTKFGVVGLDGNVTRGDCISQLDKKNWANSIAQWALEQGLDVGLVTTTRITHASPAGLYAHVSDRDWESDSHIKPDCLEKGCRDIAYQLVMQNPGRKFKVIMGGGSKHFLPKMEGARSSSGTRKDNLNLTKIWSSDKESQNASNSYITNRDELLNLLYSDNLPEYLLGLFNSDHMEYNLKAKNQPSLEEMIEVAIRMLSRSPKGYFLFVEGGRIDHAHHYKMAYIALDETIEFSKAVNKAINLTSSDDTLIVVSSDHAHTMTVAGYPSRGNDILGTVDNALGADGIPYTTISYANGKRKPIPNGTRIDVTKDELFNNRDPDYSYPGLVPLDSETHGGEDVAVFALGPWQHLFTASYEQTLVPHLMAYAMCLGDEKHENCRTKKSNYRSTTRDSNGSESRKFDGCVILCAVIIYFLSLIQQ